MLLMTIYTFELGYSVFNFGFSVSFDGFVTQVTVYSGVASVQRKPREVMVKLAWKPGFRVVTSFACRDTVYGESIPMNILVTLRT